MLREVPVVGLPKLLPGLARSLVAAAGLEADSNLACATVRVWRVLELARMWFSVMPGVAKMLLSG